MPKLSKPSVVFLLAHGLLPLWLGTLAGCTNFSANPFRYREWAEDEKYTVTFHQRVEELEKLGKNATRMGERTGSTCQELANLYQQDKDPLIREEVVKTAANFDHPFAAGIIYKAIKDEDPQVRIAACRGLSRLGGQQSLLLLSEAVESDADFDVRLEATRSLGEFEGAEALKALGLALEDPDPALQFVAVGSLKKVTGQDYGNSVPAWREYLAGGKPVVPPQSISQRLMSIF